MTEFNELVGKTFDKIVVGDDEIQFISESKQCYKLLHFQDCCESVYVESIEGTSDMAQTLAGQEILHAEEAYNSIDNKLEDYHESFTWSFYTIRTMRDTYTIRFYGSSNGYYSESAQLIESHRPVD